MSLWEQLARTSEPAISDWWADGQRATHWHAGRIVTRAGHLVLVEQRRFPYKASRLRVAWDQWRRTGPPATCELFFHKSRKQPEFLVLGYVKSERRTSLASFYCALLVLDEIARLQKVNAIVADITNSRLSNRLLNRWGWQPHCLDWTGRHFIKRFYGTYPHMPFQWHSRLRPIP